MESQFRAKESIESDLGRGEGRGIWRREQTIPLQSSISCSIFHWFLSMMLWLVWTEDCRIRACKETNQEIKRLLLGVLCFRKLSLQAKLFHLSLFWRLSAVSNWDLEAVFCARGEVPEPSWSSECARYLVIPTHSVDPVTVPCIIQ